MHNQPVTPEYLAALNARWNKLRSENNFVEAALRASLRKGAPT
jgi:hypothetical protein